ncbi:MAG: FkbM family methyltransferase [Anaerolineae bacterium]
MNPIKTARTAVHNLTTLGPRAYAKRVQTRLGLEWAQFSYDWQQRLILWQGRAVELMGNRRRLNGLWFDLSDSYIETFYKAPFLFGNYERAELALIKQYVPVDWPIVELGGAIGFTACSTNRRLTHPAEHVVLEANPRIIPTLERNRALNQCQFQIVPAALGYGAGTLTLWVPPYFYGSSTRIERGEAVDVNTTTLQKLADEAGFERFNLIVDIEGAEVDLAQHEPDVLQKRVGWLVVERHAEIVGEDVDRDFDARLKLAGFEEVDHTHLTTVYRNRNLMKQS